MEPTQYLHGCRCSTVTAGAFGKERYYIGGRLDFGEQITNFRSFLIHIAFQVSAPILEDA
jgi:hypothetical protein